MEAISDIGALERTPLPRLLLALSNARFDGCLHLQRERVEKTFRFQRGAPISAESTLASETLGLWLLDSRRITREDYHQVSAHVAQKRVKEGVALLELGLLDPKSLFLALKEQVRARLVECFAWPRGTYRIERENAAPEGALPFRADLVALIQEGIETHWNAERVLSDLATPMSQIAVPTRRLAAIAERLRRDPLVDALLGALDGSHTLWHAIQLARSPRALAAAWVIDAMGALEYRAQDAHDKPVEEDVEAEVEIVLTDAAPGPQAPEPHVRATASATAGMNEVLALEVSQKYVRLDELDYYALLGIEQDAAPAAIKRAYHEAAKRYHPDALARAGLDRETREKAGRVFTAIGKAHAVLSDPKRRRGYDASLSSDETDLDAERLAAAETNYRKGEILMKQGNFRGALDFLRPAVELWPEDATYQSALGWALYKAPPSNPALARQHLERAYALEPRNPEVAHRLSLVLKSLGEVAPAANLLNKARELDPKLAG
jgi:tetratricopeptide (TPR) repeat protein